MRVRARARVRVRAKVKSKPIEFKPFTEEECLDFAGRKGLTAWDMLKFLYDCTKKMRGR